MTSGATNTVNVKNWLRACTSRQFAVRHCTTPLDYFKFMYVITISSELAWNQNIEIFGRSFRQQVPFDVMSLIIRHNMRLRQPPSSQFPSSCFPPSGPSACARRSCHVLTQTSDASSALKVRKSPNNKPGVDSSQTVIHCCLRCVLVTNERFTRHHTNNT